MDKEQTVQRLAIVLKITMCRTSRFKRNPSPAVVTKQLNFLNCVVEPSTEAIWKVSQPCLPDVAVRSLFIKTECAVSQKSLVARITKHADRIVFRIPLLLADIPNNLKALNIRLTQQWQLEPEADRSSTWLANVACRQCKVLKFVAQLVG